MNILRTILVGLAGFVCTIAISGFIFLLAIHTTIMDRAVVKGWLATSKIYDGRLLSALIQGSATEGEYNSTLTSQPQTGSSISPETVKIALNATFTPDFVQAQTEGIVNNAYDWMEGDVPTFKFSIPIDQKRTAFIQQITKIIEPQIAALPVCKSARQMQQSTCRPSNVTIQQIASQLATQSADESGAFAAPITNESITKDGQKDPQQSNESPLAQLPAIRKGIDVLQIILPIAIAISIAIVILATRGGRRLAAAARLSRHIFFSVLLILIPAAAVIWVARDSDFGLSRLFAAQIGDVVVPLIKIIIVALAAQLVLFSGIAFAVSGVTWTGFSVWRRRLQAIEAARMPNPTLLVQPAPLPQQFKE